MLSGFQSVRTRIRELFRTAMTTIHGTNLPFPLADEMNMFKHAAGFRCVTIVPMLISHLTTSLSLDALRHPY